MSTMLNTGDLVILSPQTPRSSYLQLVDPGNGALEVWGLQLPGLANPYSASFNVFVIVRTPDWTEANQSIYLLSPWFGYLQVVEPGFYSPYAVKANGAFSDAGLGQWNSFVAYQSSAGNWGFTFNGLGTPSDLELVAEKGTSYLVLVPNAAPGSNPTFLMEFLAKGQNIPAG